MEEIDKMQSIPDLERFLPLFMISITSIFKHHHAALTQFSVFCDSVLCSVFGVDLPEPKRGVLLELYVQTVLFCRGHSFKKEQTSALLSIIKSVHEANIGKKSHIITAV